MNNTVAAAAAATAPAAANANVRPERIGARFVDAVAQAMAHPRAGWFQARACAASAPPLRSPLAIGEGCRRPAAFFAPLLLLALDSSALDLGLSGLAVTQAHLFTQSSSPNNMSSFFPLPSSRIDRTGARQ